VGAAHLTPSPSGVSLVATGNGALGQAARVTTNGNLTASQVMLAAIGTNSFQLHLWLQREKAGVAAGLLDTLQDTDTGFQLFFQANNTLRLRLDDALGNTANFDSTAIVTNDSQWHEIIVTVDRSSPTGLVFQVDGQVQVGQDPGSVPGIIAPSQDLFVGNLNTNSPLLGSLALCEILVDLPPPAVAITPASSFSRQPVQVTLTPAATNAVLRYTLDGTDPTTNSPVYSAPFTLSISAEVRASAWVNDVAGTVVAASYSIATNTPNVILFIAEDVGAGDLHHYGNPVNATPNFDALGRTGARFTQAYGTGPSNAPNQYAAITGRLLPRAGLPPFIAPGSSNGLASREWTLGEAFLKAGYHTAFIGAWHLGDAVSSVPHAQGFELFYGLAMPQEGAPLANLRENDTLLDPAPNPTNLLSQFTTRALAFLSTNAGSPFLLVLQVPPLPATGASLGGSYGNRIEAIDAALGQIIGNLDALDLRNQTLLIFASDEGPNLTASLPRGSAGMFRDGRGTTFEGGLRIPAYANWPGTILPVRVSQAIWWLPDLPPTLCAIAGLPWPADRPMDGVNRASALTGATLRPTGAEQLFFHRQTNSAPNLAAQRLGSVKYHRSLTKTDPENSYTSANLPMLFDLELDPTERFLGFITSLTGAVPALDAAAAAHLATFQPPYPQVPANATLLGNVAFWPGSGNPPSQLSFTRAADTLDQYYSLESSVDLLNWIAYPLPTLPHQTVLLPDGSEQVTLTLPAPVPGEDRTFYRIAVVLP
jgi:arylsulfatase A-like enzyme